MSQFKHGVLDDDDRCVMSGLEPAHCGGCRGHEPKPLVLQGLATWGELVEPDADALVTDLEELDPAERGDRARVVGGFDTAQERDDAFRRHALGGAGQFGF